MTMNKDGLIARMNSVISEFNGISGELSRICRHYANAGRLLDELGVPRRGRMSDYWGELNLEARIKILVRSLKRRRSG